MNKKQFESIVNVATVSFTRSELDFLYVELNRLQSMIQQEAHISLYKDANKNLEICRSIVKKILPL